MGLGCVACYADVMAMVPHRCGGFKPSTALLWRMLSDNVYLGHLYSVCCCYYYGLRRSALFCCNQRQVISIVSTGNSAWRQASEAIAS